MTISTVTLELLRLGPPHNQLLSPLTRYLGVCGNQPVEEVTVQWEHRAFLDKLMELRYDRAHDGGRLETIRQLGIDMGKMIGRIDGLKKQLAVAHGTDIAGLTHLEIVMSASELAMLPFELTRTFAGAPGSTEQFLLVQASAQIEITRRIRGAVTQPIEWPREPKVLFISAQPEGMTVPLQAHLQALVEAVRPFIPHHDENNPASLLAATRKYLHVLPRASVAEIQQLCSEVQFSYVHVLAHGLEDPNTPGKPYGLALHAGPGRDEKEIVSGDRLATALGIADRRPGVVTLAACDSGAVHEVIHNGASLAHDLHSAGVPLVIGSQFPLSFDASIEMVQQIYQQLPRGIDPRKIIHVLRRRLYAQHSTRTHDWASLIVYASLPEDLGAQLEEVEYHSSRLALEATMDRFDHQLEQLTDEKSDVDPAKIEALQTRVDETRARLPTNGLWALHAEALRAVAAKRVAQTYFHRGKLQTDNDRADLWDKSVAQLRTARGCYATAARGTMNSCAGSLLRPPVHWLLSQQLCLDLVLGRPFDREMWSIARVAATLDAAHGDDGTQLGALSGLIELHLLLLADPCTDDKQREKAGHQASAELERLIEETNGNGASTRVLYSTRQQLRRYTEWFWDAELIAFQRDRQINRGNADDEPTEPPIVVLAKRLLGQIAATSDDLEPNK